MKGTSNRVFGMLVGLVKGFSCSILFMVILTFMMGLGVMAPVRSQLDKSVVTAPVYNQVSNLTDKFMTGGQKRLEYLLHAGGFDRDGTTTPSVDDYEKYSGTYTATQTQSGFEYEWTFTLNKDKTFVLTACYTLDPDAEPTTQGEGTYSIERNGGNVILKLSFNNGNYSENPLGDGYLEFSGMHMVKQ